eukprot:431450_1
MQWRKKTNHIQPDQYAFTSDTNIQHNNQARASISDRNDHHSMNMNTNYQIRHTEFAQNNCSSDNNQYSSTRNKPNFRHRSNRYRRYSSKNSNKTRNQNNYRYNESRYYRNNTQFQKQKRSTYKSNNEVTGKGSTQLENPEFQNCPRPKVESIRLNNIKYLKDFEYFVREKSDGMKVLCYITQNSVYFIDEKFDIRMVTDVFYGSHGFVSMNKVILLDGEVVVSQRTNKHKQKCIFFRITDCIAFNGESVVKQTTSQRQKYIDIFMNIYNSKLIEYAKLRNKLSKKVNDETKSEFDDCLYEFEDKPDLSKISTQIDNNYQHTKSIKQKIINLCKRSLMFADQQLPDVDHINKIVGNNSTVLGNNILDTIDLDVISIFFTKNSLIRATKNNLLKLSKQIKYYQDSNGEEWYFFTDPTTGIKTKNDGILFIPEINSYLITNDDDKKCDNVLMIWKPKDLLTINVAIGKEISEKEKKTVTILQYDQFIAFDKLNLFIRDETQNKDVWFNAINMGENDEIESTKPPFWNSWHLKQRSKLNEIVSNLQEIKQIGNMNYFIVECNYDFNQQSWSLFKLKNDLTKPSSVAIAQDVIARMEEYIEINDIATLLQ